MSDRDRGERRRLDDLQVWTGVNEDGEEYVMLGEMTTDPDLSGAAEHVRQILRNHGLTELAGD